jgi:hypothetical protein
MLVVHIAVGERTFKTLERLYPGEPVRTDLELVENLLQRAIDDLWTRY